MNIYIDFSVCPCGEQNAIQPTKLVIPDVHPQPSAPVEGAIAVACKKCKRVYSFDTDYLVSIPSPQGLAPYVPDSPMRVFRVRVVCDQPNCAARPVIHAEMNASTSAEQLRQKALSWRWSQGDLRCTEGHAIPWPQWKT